MTVDLTGDTFGENDESLRLKQTSPSGAVLSDRKAVATIVDDDAPSYLHVNDLAVHEGDAGPSRPRSP